MTRLAIMVLFSFLVAHFIWRAFDPIPPAVYPVTVDGTAMAAPEPDATNLYLRRTLHLADAPRHAWIKVVVQGQLLVYVNGQVAQRRKRSGLANTAMIDLVPYLVKGTNVIGIVAAQTHNGVPPQVSVEGAYTLGRIEYPLESDQAWRCNTLHERGGGWWFSTEFNDRHWRRPRLMAKTALYGSVDVPPRTVTEPRIGRWISPHRIAGRVASVRRKFHIDGRPHRAWLRLATDASYHLAVNGMILDQQDIRLGTDDPGRPVERIYDLTYMIKPGQNIITVLLFSETVSTTLMGDLEVKDQTGTTLCRLGTDGLWTSRPGLDGQWLDTTPQSMSGDECCFVVAGDVGWLPGDITRDHITIHLSTDWQRLAMRIVLVPIVALATWLLCFLVGRALTLAGAPTGDATGLACLTLIVPSLLLGAAFMAIPNPFFLEEDVYRSHFFLAALITVPAQWLLLSMLVFTRKTPASENLTVCCGRSSRRGLISVVVVSFMVIGFGLRLRGIDTVPLNSDESHMYRCLHGFIERGWPSVEIHHDHPVQYVATSMMIYVGPLLAQMIFDDPHYILRFPSVCWGTLTILVIYLAGRRMFGATAGLTAAMIYTFSTACIEMANFGRYPSQLQLLALLTIYQFWRAVGGSGSIRHRGVWLAAICFLLMFLSWQASALLALGMTVAVLVHRREQLRSVFCNTSVWLATLMIIAVVALQHAHREFQQIHRLNHGTGASEITFLPMWKYAEFNLWGVLQDASWNDHSVLPIAAVLGAILLMAKRRWLAPVRYLLITLMVTSMTMSMLLPVFASRYAYFLIPLVILLASAAFTAMAQQLVKMATKTHRGWRLYGQGIGAVAVIGGILLCRGVADQLHEIEFLQRTGERPRKLAGRNLVTAAEHLRNRLRKGDAVISTQPYLVEHYMSTHQPPLLDRARSWWLQTKLHQQTVLADHSTIPRNRRDGTPLVSSVEGLDRLFTQHPRIWFVATRGHFSRLNNDETGSFLRQHMQVVHEGLDAVVLFREGKHWPALQRFGDEEALNAQEILPVKGR